MPVVIDQFWYEFNDVYISFIQDIDYYLASSKRKKLIDQQIPIEQLPSKVIMIRELLAKHGGQLTKVPAINMNLLQMIRALKDEDKRETSPIQASNRISGGEGSLNDTTLHGAMGDNLEFFIENKIIETLAAYAITDQPQGFFKFLLGAMEDLIKSVNKQTSLLSHKSVN